MTSNFWGPCAISALKISKNHFATFDYFVNMKLVSTVTHINATKLICLLTVYDIELSHFEEKYAHTNFHFK